ncbi:MAG: hypothetical protein JRF40_14405 [Deltaproteobacteria bacterium]|nr:hypothetical protein [Deltaproteobacteria bacterium]
MGMIKKKRCKNCKRLFIPDYRNRNRQNYCKRDKCRKASKVASQEKWVDKPENRNYFRGPENVQRVQDWRRQNPGYWKQSSNKVIALQDPLTTQLSENNKDNRELQNDALQDLLKAQPLVMIGLISNFIGSALQDDIADTLLRMQQSGQDILYCQPQKRGGKDDCEIPNFTPTGA